MGLGADDLQLVEGDLPEVDGYGFWLVTNDHHTPTIGHQTKCAKERVGTTGAFEDDSWLVRVQLFLGPWGGEVADRHRSKARCNGQSLRVEVHGGHSRPRRRCRVNDEAADTTGPEHHDPVAIFHPTAASGVQRDRHRLGQCGEIGGDREPRQVVAARSGYHGSLGQTPVGVEPDGPVGVTEIGLTLLAWRAFTAGNTSADTDQVTLGEAGDPIADADHPS